MKCRRIQMRLQAWLDGTLGWREAARIETHLARCAACRHEREVLRAIDAALSSEPVVEPPQSMAPAIVGRALARSRMARPALIPAWLEALTLAGLGSALAAVAFIMVTLGRTFAIFHSLGLSPVTVAALIVCGGLALFGSLYYGTQT